MNKLSFDGSEAITFLNDTFFRYFDSVGLDPYKAAEWKQGVFQLFGIQTFNLPDMDKQNYILAANHISDIDALILGLLCPRIRIVAKTGWTSNGRLMDFLGLHYDIIGVYRDFEIAKLNEEQQQTAKKHNFKVTKDAVKFLKSDDEARHLLIFPQGTISDINKNSKERVNPGFAKMAIAAKVNVVNIFIEYPGIDGNTRIVCGTPYAPRRSDDFGRGWLYDVITLQNQLDNVRTPNLSERHSLNNKPGEPFWEGT